MLNSIFVWLSEAMHGSIGLALFASLIWGVLSIVLSPCHLASIPLIVGFVDNQGKISTKRAFAISSLFSLGILLTIGIVGVITASMGRMMGDVGRYGNYIVAIIFFLVGMHMIGLIPMPFAGKANQPKYQKKGMLAAFILGLVFGIALGPCTFAFMAPVLTVSFGLAAKNFLLATLIILLYGIGHCSVIIVAGTYTEVVQRYLNWSDKSKGAVILKKVCACLVILAGVYLLWKV
jgi:cytochrome c-type biogenesis protein